MAFRSWELSGGPGPRREKFSAGGVVASLHRGNAIVDDDDETDEEEEMRKALREVGIEVEVEESEATVLKRKPTVKSSPAKRSSVKETSVSRPTQLPSSLSQPAPSSCDTGSPRKDPPSPLKKLQSLRQSATATQDGLVAEDKAIEAGRSDIANLLEQQKNNPEQFWFPLHLNRRVCYLFAARRDQTDLCHCGLRKEQHVTPDSGLRIMEPEDTWSESKAMVSLPSDAFGEIEFSGLNQTAKFVRLEGQTDQGVVQQVLMKKWELNKPTLIISIFGGNFEKKRQLRMIFKKGLWKAAESAGCWIVTGGFNLGIMKLTGEAVRDYTDAYGGNHMIAIGVSGWGCVARNEVLTSASYEGTYPAIYQSEEDNPADVVRANSDEEEAPLDPNHTHFLLVDTGMAHLKGQESAFRTCFERTISRWKEEEDSVEVKVPMCGLLIGGDRFTIHQVYLALIENHCPIVVHKGTCGAADVVAAAWEAWDSRNLVADEKEEIDEEKDLEAKIHTCILTFLSDIHKDVYDFSTEVEMLTEVIPKLSHLIQIYDLEEDFDLDRKIISSLLSSASTDLASDQLNLEQLKICLTLNRPDIARDQIFLENKKWKKGDLNDYMFQALMDDRHEFVKLFLEQGFSLEEFLTVFMLEKLYTDQLKKMNSKVAIFHQLWEYHRSHRNNKKVSLREVGKVIRVLVGDFYHPLYLRKDFMAKITSANSGSETGKDEDESHSHGSHGYENPMITHTTPEENKKNKANHRTSPERKAKQVQLDRPARELMIWSILVGKLQMAELFWTMEKEPIAGALLSKMVLAALQKRTDDFTDKEDFQNYAAFFETQAEGVLNECYREDERRAQNLINRELYYYGLSSCIVLSAEGESIRFMAHPCCQDFLTSTWMGKLSPKNALGRFSFGILLGLTMPIMLPKCILYKLMEEDINKPAAAKQEKDKQLTPRRATQRSSTKDKDKDKDRRGSAGSVVVEMSNIAEGGQYYPGQENVPVHVHHHDHHHDHHRDHDEDLIQRSDRLNCEQFVQRIRDFYMAPVVRFVYNTLAYLAFLIVFSFMLLFDLQIEIRPIEGLIIAWMITLLLEEIKQATLSGISFSTYISDGWNKLDCIAVSLFVIGFVLRTISYLREQHSQYYHNHQIQPELYDQFFITGRIFLAFSLFAYYIRLMYIFSFHIALGPKLIMIGKMVINDLIPFMVILVVFVLGYGVASHSIAYPRGLYTPHSDLRLKPNFTEPKPMSQQRIFIHFLTQAYFQMFGDFGLSDIQGEAKSCKEDGECPNYTSTWLVPIMLSIYVLLTNILMFNLLIAMFSRTYDSIESSSTYYWNYQRYQMIQEYVERSPLAPPLIIIWHVYELVNYIKLRCAGVKLEELEDPFKRSYKDNRKKERELIKWEHMKAMDYLRNLAEPQGGRKSKGGEGGKSVILKAAAPASAFANNAAAAMQQQMTDATGTLGLEMEKRFREIDSNLQRFDTIESKLNELQTTMANFSNVVNDIVQYQMEMRRIMADLPFCKCSPEGGGVTQEQLQQAVSAAIDHQVPDWFSEAATQVVKTVIDQTPVNVAPEVIDLIARSKPEPREEAPVQAAPDSPTPTDSDAESEQPDEVITPDVSDPRTGRVIERSCLEHRLWRISPFNFEKYPGMRMNVPADRIPWEIEYRDYFAYDASDEVLIFPTELCHDNPNVDLRNLAYNQYDTTFRIRRQSLIGRYRTDPANGAPLNPMGRTGLKEKGLLPHWGPNHAMVAVITRWSRTPSGGLMRRNGHPILQCVSLFRNKQFCLPWYLTDHLPRCDFDHCVPLTLKTLIHHRLKTVFQSERARQEFRPVEKGRADQIFKGYLDDHLNADNAWIEAVVINIHEHDDWKFSDAILQVFEEPNVDEAIKWMEVAYSTALRPSHCDILKTVAQTHNAYF